MGIFGAHASVFLVVVSILTILFAAPIAFAPLSWARVFRWEIPERTDLAVYFGRCLGMVVTALAVMALVAARQPAVQPFFFMTIFVVVGGNVVVHVFGAVRRIQPRSETIEIAVWLALFAAAILFYPRR